MGNINRKFISIKTPDHMKKWTWIYAGLFLLGLICLFSPGWGLIYHIYLGWLGSLFALYLLWRLLRGMRYRMFKLKNHIWSLEFEEEDKNLHFLIHHNFFRSKSDSFSFEETTCVIHKSNISRLTFQAPGILQLHKSEEEVSFVLKFLRGIVVFLAAIFFSSVILITPLQKLIAEAIYGSEEPYDLRPTAVSFVKGRNTKSLIMLPTYRWKQETLEGIVDICKSLGIRVLDKRPHAEKKKNIFI